MFTWQGTELTALVDGARQRMRQVGMSDEQIRIVETTGQVQPRVTITAPMRLSARVLTTDSRLAVGSMVITPARLPDRMALTVMGTSLR